MTRHELSTGHGFSVAKLPHSRILDEQEFGTAWELRPGYFHTIKMHGKLVTTPRWQQAYGKDYEYTGRVNTALPVETLTMPVPKIRAIVSWCRDRIDQRLNGLLLNWYDGTSAITLGSTETARRIWPKVLQSSRFRLAKGVPFVCVLGGLPANTSTSTLRTAPCSLCHTRQTLPGLTRSPKAEGLGGEESLSP
jgi:hypothetical protein